MSVEAKPLSSEFGTYVPGDADDNISVSVVSLVWLLRKCRETMKKLSNLFTGRIQFDNILTRGALIHWQTNTRHTGSPIASLFFVIGRWLKTVHVKPTK
ncbi:unnamed protein product [Prunus armeniaca]